MSYVTFEGLGSTDGSVDQTDPTSWSPTAKTATFAVGAVLVGGVLVAALAHANRCPRLRVRWSESMKIDRELAEMTRIEAERHGCSWAQGSLRSRIARQGA